MISKRMNAKKSGYFIEENKNSKITLFASGSELSLALKIYQLLKKKNFFKFGFYALY